MKTRKPLARENTDDQVVIGFSFKATQSWVNSTELKIVLTF